MIDTSKEAIAEILDAPERIWRVKPWAESQHKHGLASWPVREHAGEGAAEYVRADLHAEAIEALKSKVKALREENYQLWQARLKPKTPNIDTLFGVELGEVLDMVIAQQEQQT